MLSFLSYFVVVSRRQQTPLLGVIRLVSSTCHSPSQLGVLQLAVEAFTACDGARYWLRSQLLPTPSAFDTPVRGFPSENCHDVWYGKTRVVWLPESEKILKIYLFVSTESMNVTDRQTNTAWWDRARFIASLGKNQPEWSQAAVQHSHLVDLRPVTNADNDLTNI